MSGILYGTSSWSEPSWSGVFYPKGMRPGEYLSHYATRFRTVEADVTYYRVPSSDMVAGWDRKTPDGFVLSAKFPRSIVHGGDGRVPDPERVLRPEVVSEDLDAFLKAMALLGPKCGPLVLQFPYFNRTVFADAEPFLERLDAFLGALPDRFRYAVEIRNKAWFGKPLLDVLRCHRAALVLVEIGYLPHPFHLARRIDPVTTDFTYCRLIGDRKEVEELTDRFDRIVVDRRSPLRRWADLLDDVLTRVDRGFVYANNHYAGHGPATISELAAMLQARGVDAREVG